MSETTNTTDFAAGELIGGLSGCLRALDHPISVVRRAGNLVALNSSPGEAVPQAEVLAYAPAVSISSFGAESFKKCYGVRYACVSGAMANGIASTDMVIAMGKAGMLGAFGAAGLSSSALDAAIQTIQRALPDGPYAFNLLYSPHDETLEKRTVEKYLDQGVHVVEAAAYIDMSAPLVRYRAAGLGLSPDGQILIANRIIAKVSRKEVAQKFMEPAPENILRSLVEAGQITPEQAELARRLPVADDITVEGDSGGHTDNRPLVCLLPCMVALRDEIQAKYGYPREVRIGAAGGISTPEAALAAFMMGAAYVVTGTVNQTCVESGTSPHIKNLLAQAALTDVSMAPSADMFEMGVKVQVLKKGTLYPMRAAKLYELYTRYDSLDQIPAAELDKVSRQIFQRDVEDIWQETVRFFSERDPAQIEKAQKNPKHKMALVFRWYLGLSSRWAIANEKGREMDYQIWCGPSVGSFNDWTRNTYLEKPENRRVVDVAFQIMTGAAYLYRLNLIKIQGLRVSGSDARYVPSASLIEGFDADI